MKVDAKSSPSENVFFLVSIKLVARRRNKSDGKGILRTHGFNHKIFSFFTQSAVENVDERKTIFSSDFMVSVLFWRKSFSGVCGRWKNILRNGKKIIFAFAFHRAPSRDIITHPIGSAHPPFSSSPLANRKISSAGGQMRNVVSDIIK